MTQFEDLRAASESTDSGGGNRDADGGTSTNDVTGARGKNVAADAAAQV